MCQQEDVTQDLTRLPRTIQKEIKVPHIMRVSRGKESAVALPSLLLAFLRQLLDVGSGGDGDGGTEIRALHRTPCTALPEEEDGRQIP